MAVRRRISEKVAYLKGLARRPGPGQRAFEGGQDHRKDHRRPGGRGASPWRTCEVEAEALTDGMESMAEDLSDVETALFPRRGRRGRGRHPGPVSTWAMISSRSSARAAASDIVIDESVLDIGEVTCPNCGDRFSMDLVEEPEDRDRRRG